MNKEISLNQGRWLVRHTKDVQAHGGVCHAMATEWVFAQLRDTAWDAGTEYWRGMSHQRAYALAWQEALSGLWGSAQYNAYLQIAVPPTERFVQDPARRANLPFHSDLVYSFNHLAPHALAMGARTGIVMVMFGSNPNWPSSGQNWGHTVAMARDRAGVYRFLDVNSGQYSWAPAASANTVARDVAAFLEDQYGNWGLRHLYMFTVG